VGRLCFENSLSMKSYRTTLIASAAFLAVAFLSSAATAQEDELPNAPGREVVMEVCTQCHTAGVIASPKRSRDDWAQVFDRMEGMGAAFSQAQYQVMLNYLTTHVGINPPTAPAATPAAPAAPAAEHAGH
jgi:mono/diheme cytochrome c family protein